MKRIILVLILFFVSLSSYSQVNVGVRAGGMLANMDLQQVEGNRIKPSYYLGAFAEVSLSEKLLLRPELIFSNKGTQFSGHELYNDGTINYEYLGVPLLLGYRASQRLTLLAGPEINFLGWYYSRFGGNRQMLGNPNRKVDWALNWGVAYSLTPRLGVDIRYSHGLSNYFHFVYSAKTGSPGTLRTEGAHKVLQLGLTYRIRVWRGKSTDGKLN